MTTYQRNYERLPDIIYPTHHCFDDAIAICDDMIERNIGNPRLHSTLRVCHGFVWDLGSESWYAHAWVEHEGPEGVIVIQKGIENEVEITYALSKQEFYANHTPKDVMRYSLKDVNRQINRVGTSGPWNAKFHGAVHWTS